MVSDLVAHMDRLRWLTCIGFGGALESDLVVLFNADSVAHIIGICSRLIGDLQKWLTIEVDLGFIVPNFFHFYLSSGDVTAEGGSYLPRTFTSKKFLDLRLDPTFIPHTSAMDGGTASFNVQLSANYDRYHNEFPAELAEPLLHWLDLKTFPLRASVGGDWSLSEHTAGKWNATNVGGGSGFYEYRWEHWYSCPSDGGTRYTRGVRCNAWHSAGRGDDYYKVDSLSMRYNPHKITVTVTDRYARGLAAATDTTTVEVRLGGGGGGGHDKCDYVPCYGAPHLEGNYPNPFNPSTVIRFSLPAAREVTLKVYDMTGREVATLADRFFSAGSQSVVFDGSSLASGVYYYTIRSEGHIETRSMQLIK